ncbi:MAG TPA: class I tRNA ligase family protein, partial [Candidatus Saccharimonadales bacterium]|nr:class I tRNA ligase family protein [Candidatus Saccharimonadales bacterium]
DEGMIRSDVPQFGGMYYLDANKPINEDLKARGLLYQETPFVHSVPTCWRCHTRLYYAPQDAWFVNIQDMKEKLKKTNELINWFPSHFKYGRFLKSMEHAPDWNISRSRYWGSPVPVWECECGKRYVPGSIAELEALSGEKITDLHKPEIDEVTIKCENCGEFARRVPEVLDSWIEAGSASFAERHFPFNTKEKLEDFFPPDFIVEYTGQIRAWFYVLHVIGTALFDSPAFKNVVVTGVILGTDGRKMSKNYGNYPDPKELLQKYGGDALRLYLLSTPVMHGEDIIISEEQYRNQVRGFLLILWNIYNYFVTYANENGFDPKTMSGEKSENVLDRWILSLTHSLNKKLASAIENYDTVTTVDVAKKFIDEFSTWYIRRSRDRISAVAENEEDKKAFFETTYTVLITLCKLLAPLTPFITEEMYRNLTGEESVHLTYWPEIDETLIDEKLENEMMHARKVVEMAHAQRKDAGLKLRQPLAGLSAVVPLGLSDDVQKVIADEVNVKTVQIKLGEELSVSIDTVITPELAEEGDARSIARQIQEERKKLGTTMSEQVDVTLTSWPKAFEGYIKKKALVRTVKQGETFLVERV